MSPQDNFSWKDTFFQEDFSVDDCLSKLTQKVNLGTLKSYLKDYGDELHRQMAEILKTETEAIVNLAEYLTNLNMKIDELSVSLSQLREELKVLHSLIKNAETDYRKTLDNKTMSENENKGLLARLDFISITVYVDNIIRTINLNEPQDLINLERAVYKYSFQRNYLKELGIAEMNGVIMETENKLLSMVHQQFLKSIDEKSVDTITRCLRLYANLEKTREAEEFYQVNIIRPILQPMYSEKSLDKFDQDVEKIYVKTLNFLNSNMQILEDILLNDSYLKKSFNFILRSFWVEVDRQCRKGLPHITAPGNPELFQRRFVSTWNLLAEISNKCGKENLIKTHPSFQDHLKRFNLPVYFEIRFQQVASQFETDLTIKTDDSSMFIGYNDFGFKLKITLNLYVALKKCFDDHVFINQLADQFLKFSMFLLSRYLMWFDEALKKKNGFANWENFVMNSLVDMQRMIDLLGDEESLESPEHMYVIFPKKMEPVIKKILKSNNRIITQFSNKMSNCFVSSKVSECSDQLQNVAAIPRLFRRTNRNPPKEASTYMVEALKPILQFNEIYKDSHKGILEPLLENVISRITQQYSTQVQDVLQSVCKTEESLRRLKNRNVTSTDDTSSSPSSETMSDETKIREQIKLDVNYFITTLSRIAKSSSKNELSRLAKSFP